MTAIPTISVVMIAYDEEETLPRALASVAGLYDELVVAVDSRTTDQTASIAAECGAIGGPKVQVYPYIWEDNFSKARNDAYAMATGDWIVWMDADDVLMAGGVPLLLNAIWKADAEGKTSITTPYVLQTEADGTTPLTKSNLKVRATKKGALKWLYRIHEVPDYDWSKDVLRKDIFVYHKKGPDRGNACKDRNLRMIERAIVEGCEDWMLPRYLFYLARERKYHADWDGALAAFREYLPKSFWPPEKNRALLDMADIHMNRKEYEEAAKRAFEAILVDPAWPDSYITLMWVAYHQQKWQSCADWAVLALRHVRKIHPLFDWGPNRTRIPHMILSVALWNLKEWEEGLLHARIALSYYPNDTLLQVNVRFFEEKIEEMAA